jgi:uncharacterized membrane protein YjjP (DUF1212 family)
MRTTTRWIAVVVAGLAAVITAGLVGTALLGTALLGTAELGIAAQAATPTPTAGATRTSTQPPSSVAPTANPSAPSATPTAPTAQPTSSATGPTTATPLSPSPTRASPSATPSATPTSTPVERPATPPASSNNNLTIWSLVIALAVLAGAVPILVELARSAPSPTGAGVSDTTTIHPDDSARTLALMSEVGEAMVDSGYDVISAQSAMEDIARANGMPHAESIALPTMVMVSARVSGQLRTGAVNTGRRPMRLHQVEELDDVVNSARHGRIPPAEAVAEIARIRALPPPYSARMQLLGSVLTSTAVSVLLGASPTGMIVAAILGTLVGAILLAGVRIPPRYQVLLTVTSAFVVALSVFLLSRTSLDIGVLPSLVAPLALLLPGALLTTSVIELSTGQMISGSGRVAAGAMQLVLLALGIVAAAALVGVPAIELSGAASPFGPIGPWIAVAVFGVGVVLNRCARPRSLGWITLVLYVAYGAQVVGSSLLGGVLSAFVGAVAMTPAAAIVARQRSGPPAMVSFTPAFWLLVPGALGLVGVTSILDGDSNGLQTLLTTVSTMVAIALGVLVGWALVGMFRRVRGLRGSRASDGEQSADAVDEE